ncbi:hypothetical protein LRN56_17015, partial [Staphylococcus aureus]|nr:hypothetical protein [Staphylococcus aureus]
LSTGGITPTGPAIREATLQFEKIRSRRGMLADDERRFDEFGM